MTTMYTLHRQRSRDRLLLLVVCLCGVAITLFPRTAYACGLTDMGSCSDQMEYGLYKFVAGTFWMVNRFLLLVAYQFDKLREFLIGTAFTSAYQAVVTFIQPAYAPIAVFALLLAAALFMLVPITGDLRIASIRSVILWAAFTPAIILIAGNMIGEAEQIRSDVSTSLFAEVSKVTPGAIFGLPGEEMPAPTALYPNTACGTELKRMGTGMAMDSLAAALMYADAVDIHCPGTTPISMNVPALPNAYFSKTPGWAYDGNLGSMNNVSERRKWVGNMQTAAIRQGQGLFPSALAVVESTIHLLFSLCMVVLWMSLPIGLMFVWFQQSSAPLRTLLTRAVSIMQTSWTVSILLGFIGSALTAAATLRNAAAYAGLAFGAFCLSLYLAFVALITMKKSIAAVDEMISTTTGNATLGEPGGATARATAGVAAAGLSAGAAIVSGGTSLALQGAGTALTGATAWRQTQGVSMGQRMVYSGAAMLGRNSHHAAQVGEVAAGMGWIDPEGAMLRGIAAGSLSIRDRDVQYRLQQQRHQRRAMSADGAALMGISLGTPIAHPRAGRNVSAPGASGSTKAGKASRAASSSVHPKVHQNEWGALRYGDAIPSEDEPRVVNPEMAALRDVRAIHPHHQATSAAQQQAVVQRAAAIGKLYRIGAQRLSKEEATLRKQGDTAGAARKQSQQAAYVQRAKQYEAIAAAGTVQSQGGHTPDVRAHRQAVYQASRFEVEADFAEERADLELALPSLHQRQDEIQEEMGNIQKMGDVLIASYQQQGYTDAEKRARDRIKYELMDKAQEHAHVRQQIDDIQQRLKTVTPPKQGPWIAVQQEAAQRAKKRLKP